MDIRKIETALKKFNPDLKVEKCGAGFKVIDTLVDDYVYFGATISSEIGTTFGFQDFIERAYILMEYYRKQKVN